MVKNRKHPSSSSCRTLLFAAAMFVTATLLGCGDRIERVYMLGKVTYEGRPVEDGQIRFIPAPGTEMPLTVEKIKNGRYATEINGGVPVGAYQVAILAFNPSDPVPSGPGEPYRRQFIPAKYNTRTELTVTLESGQKKLEHDFELPK